MAVAAARRRKQPPRRSFAPRFLLVLLAIAIVGAMAIEPTRQLIQQRDRIAAMSSELDEIQSQNDALETRIGRLQDPDYIEQRAREQVGLVLPGETAVVVMPPTRKQAAKQQAKEEARATAVPEAPTPKPEPGPIESFLRFLGF